MARRSLFDQQHELIKAHMLNPGESPLPEHMQELLNRIVGMAKLLEKNPTIKHAVAIHKTKYPDLSDWAAYNDARLARKIYNSHHEFDYDFWKSWIINDIIDNIEKCRNADSYHDRRVISAEHANLLKAVGDRPEELPDPKRTEKHEFYIMININSQSFRLNLDNLDKLSPTTLKELNKALSGGEEITEEKALKIMNS